MEREIRVRFTGDARDMQRASEDARRALNTMGRDTAEFSRNATHSMQRVSESTNQMARDMAAELGKMAAAYASVGAAAALFWKGLSHNAELESLKLGMATIVSANETVKDSTGKQIEGSQKLAVAQGQVAQVFERMKLDAINTTATMPQLAQAFNAALAPAMAMGVSLDDTRKLTVGMVQAMGAMGIPLDQARQEINSILQAQISEDSQLAKNLGLNNEMVKSWKEQGTLVQHLQEKLKDFTVAGAAAGETWNGVTSTLQDNISSLLGVMTGASFDTLKSKLGELNKSFGPEGQAEAAEWGQIINDSLVTAIALGGKVGSVLLRGADRFKEALQGIRIAGVHLGAAVGRGDTVTNFLKGTPTMMPGAGKQEGVTPAGKATMEFLAGSPSGLLLPIAQRTMDGKTFDQFRHLLETLDKGIAEAKDEGVKNILFKHEEDARKTVEEAKRLAAGKKITPKKPPAPTAKAPKATHIGTLYGPELPTPDDQIRVTMGAEFGPATSDVAKGYIEAEKALAAWRKQDEKEIQEIRDANNKKNTDAEKLIGEMRLKFLIDGIKAGGDLAGQIASGKAVSGGDFLRGIGGIAGGAVSLVNPIAGAGINAGFSVVGSVADKQQEDADSYRRYYGLTQMPITGGEQGLRERKKALEEEVNKRSKESLWNWDTQGHKEFNDLKNALSSVTAQLDSLDKKTQEAAEAQAAYSARLAEAEKSVSAFGALDKVAGLRESLGLGKRSASDISNALMMSGAGIGLGMISDATSQGKMLDALQGLLYSQSLGQGQYDPSKTGMITSANSSAKNAYDILSALGMDVSGKSVNELVTLLQGIVIPAMQDLKSITGGAAAGSISGAGTDNALAFDAPTVRNLQVTQNISVNTYAVTGDKASFRALVKDIMTEANTVLGQAV